MFGSLSAATAIPAISVLVARMFQAFSRPQNNSAWVVWRLCFLPQGACTTVSVQTPTTPITGVRVFSFLRPTVRLPTCFVRRVAPVFQRSQRATSSSKIVCPMERLHGIFSSKVLGMDRVRLPFRPRAGTTVTMEVMAAHHRLGQAIQTLRVRQSRHPMELQPVVETTEHLQILPRQKSKKRMCSPM